MLRIAKQTVHQLDGTVVASEVLARLQIGNSQISPLAFMSGCSPESWYALDIEVLRLVASCEELRNATVPTFINVSPATLENDHYFTAFCAEVSRLVDQMSARVVIEIPETSQLSGQELSRKLHQIEFSGAQIAIDDFGTDFADFERLTLHPWAYCKIDLAAFQAKDNLNWLDAAITYARDNGIQLIMEKLECLTHVEVMSPVKNTAWFQGYVYARPLLVSTPNAVFGLPREPLQQRETLAAMRA